MRRSSIASLGFAPTGLAPSGSTFCGTTRRSRVAGSVNWAFVIALFAALIFIFMWYTASDDRDTIKKENATYVKAYNESKVQLEAAIGHITSLTDVLGFKTLSVNLGGRNVPMSDVAKVRQHLDKAGEVEVVQADGSKVVEPGFMASLWKLEVQIDQSSRSGGNPGVTETVVDLSQVSPKFREAVANLAALGQAVPPKPAVPVDSDDAAAQAKYKADFEAYTKAAEALAAAGKAFHESGEFAAERKKLTQTIGLPAIIDPDTWKGVKLSFAPKVDVPITSVELAFPQWRPVWEAISGELRANKGADRQTIDKLNADLKAERQVVVDQNKRYEDLNTTLKAEIDAKARELEEANKRAAANEQVARQAEAALAMQIAERKREVGTLSSELGAHKERLAADKERRDLSIRRDEVDGRLVGVNQLLETGTIDLGSDDKVYPGLKFVVSTVDRGGARQPKGEVQVIQVTGRNSSKVRIVSAVAQMGSGDLISNPFFSSGAAIHIYTVGWTPDFVQRKRIEAMNVVIDAAPTANTDYYVVPDEWKGGTAAPVEGEEPAAAGASPLDKARQEANNFGAQLVTRRMLETYLKL